MDVTPVHRKHFVDLLTQGYSVVIACSTERHAFDANKITDEITEHNSKPLLSAVQLVQKDDSAQAGLQLAMMVHTAIDNLATEFEVLARDFSHDEIFVFKPGSEQMKFVPELKAVS